MSIAWQLARLPFVGRSAELTELRTRLERARSGNAGILVLAGDPGIGKSRMMSVLADEARRGGWSVATGRAYPLGPGAPYALFADAFVPVLREMDPSRLRVLLRGGEAQLTQLFPALAAAGRSRSDGVSAGTERDGEEGRGHGGADRTQLFWTFAELLRRLAEREPLLIFLDDLHWADASSLELLHFLARQLTSESIAIFGSLNESHRDAHPTLGTTLQSLQSLGVLRQLRIGAFTRETTDELVREVFSVEARVSREFSAHLFGWTRGNPYFIEETLKSLVESGRLRQHGGSWLGWEVAELEMPPTIRDAIRVRVARLSGAARQVLELVSVMGARSGYDALRALSELGEAELVAALDELCAAQVLVEGGNARDPYYDFAHPMLALTLHGDIGLARRRLLHGRIAEALERGYGAHALEHADELARHYAQSQTRDLSWKAVKYLAAAGRAALARFANREAADYLSAALQRIDDDSAPAAAPSAPGSAAESAAAAAPESAGESARESAESAQPPSRFAVLDDLGRARQRLGQFDEAIRLWARAIEDAEQRGDAAGAASALWRIGLAHFRTGVYPEALEAFGRALESAQSAGPPRLVVAVRLARGACLEALGRVQEARSELEAALAGAEAAGDDRLRARSHRALLLLHTLVGPPALARAHGAQAIALAGASGDPALACTCHWGMAVLEGLTGHGEACDRHMDASARIAESLNSPLLRLAVDEVQVEHAFGRGDWDTALAIGERAIALARGLNQRALLPRLLVWTALIYLGRDDLERAKQYIDDAWRLSGADDPTRAGDVHSVVPAHIGRASYHAALGEWEEAISVGRRGLAIVDRTGYTAWAVHRLLPIIIEAQLFKQDVGGARETLDRLRRDAAALDHPLGLAWVATGDAISEYMTGNVAKSLGMLRDAAERLEAVPYVPDAARLRRQLAGRLWDTGDRDGAIRELRRVHEVFVRLGAQREIEKTRVQFGELSARPPTRTAGGGTEALTEREVEIVRLVAEHKSNKAIGKLLGISPRTVGTHLSNIYGKLDVASRAELSARAPVILSLSAPPTA